MFTSAGTQQSDTKRQHLLERLLDAVKQVSHLYVLYVGDSMVPDFTEKYVLTLLVTWISEFLP